MIELLVSAAAVLVVLAVVVLAATAIGLVSVRERYRGRTSALAEPPVDEPVHEDDPADPLVR